jgi:hypothetical protein
MDTFGYLVTGDSCACLSLLRFTSSCLDFPKIAHFALHTAHAPFTGFAWAAANKLKFNYLNGNLMVPQIHLFSLSFDFNANRRMAKAANAFFNGEQK